MKLKKILSKKNTINFLDNIKSRNFSYALQKMIIFFVIFLFSFLILSDYNLFNARIIAMFITEWPILVWKIFIIFAITSVAYVIADFISGSHNRKIFTWIVMIIFIVYVLCIYFFVGLTPISSNSDLSLKQYIKIIPPTVLLIVFHLWEVAITFRNSPFQSKRAIFRTISAISWYGIVTTGFLIGHFIIVEKVKFNIDNEIYITLITLFITFLSFFLFFHFLSIFKFKNIKFHEFANSSSLLTILPIFVAVVIWLYTNTFELKSSMKFEIMYFVLSLIIVLGLIVFAVFFAKEIKNSKVMNAIYATALLMIWIGAFTYVEMTGIKNEAYIVVNTAGVMSSIIFILIAIYEKTTKSTSFDSIIFSIFIYLMLLVILVFSVLGKARLFAEITIIFDLASLLPALLIVIPSIYFGLSIFKILYAQSRITHAIRVEQKIKIKNYKLLVKEQKNKGVENV